MRLLDQLVSLVGLDNAAGTSDDKVSPHCGALMRHHARRAVLTLSLALALAPAANAQFTEAQPGARVRITAPGVVAGRYVGTVLAREPGTLRVGSENTPPIDVPIDRITSLEISRGNSRWAGAGRGAAMGVPIGAVLGLVAGSAGTTERTYFDYNQGRLDTLGRGELVLYSAVSGALFGAAIGALVPKEHWDRFDVASRTGLDPRRRRMELGLSLAY
jgi:hypothetical protein